MSALDKVLLAAGWGSDLEDTSAELVLAAMTAVREIPLLLAKADGPPPDDDSDDDSSGDGKDADGDHTGHATYKALMAKKVPPKRAAAMCAQADKKVKASQLAESASIILAGLFDRDGGMISLAAPPGDSASDRKAAVACGHALPDGSYHISSVASLHGAAVLAMSGHGNWRAARPLIQHRAGELGVDCTTLPGFGGNSPADNRLAVALAAQQQVPMHHPPFTGKHSHPHAQTSAHDHDHQHFNDNNHGGGPAHRTGSHPSRPYDW